MNLLPDAGRDMISLEPGRQHLASCLRNFVVAAVVVDVVIAAWLKFEDVDTVLGRFGEKLQTKGNVRKN